MALAHGKIVQNVQAANNKKMETFMDFTKDRLKQIVSANKSKGNNGNGNTSRNGNTNGNKSGSCHQARCCAHCKLFYPSKPDDKCWNLPQNAINGPKGYVVPQPDANTQTSAWLPLALLPHSSLNLRQHLSRPILQNVICHHGNVVMPNILPMPWSTKLFCTF